MAAKKLKAGEPTVDDIKDMYYLTLEEVGRRSTYSRESLNRFIREKKLIVEKKNKGKVVVRVCEYVRWWESL